MAYIASRPVHFDRDYKIGEVVPPEIIDPKMARKLIEMGKIVQVNLPSDEKKEPDAQEPDAQPDEKSAENASDGVDSSVDTSTPETAEMSQEPQESGGTEAKMLGHLDAEQLATWKNADLEKLAADLGVDISKAKNRAERAQLIAAAEVQAPVNGDDTGEGAL